MHSNTGQTKSMDVVEMRTLTWMTGMTIRDKISNGVHQMISQSGSVKRISQCGLRWFGRGTNIQRKNGHVGK